MAEAPVYDKTVKLELSPQPDVNSAAQMMINNFRQFANGTTEAVVAYNKHETAERQDIIKNNISATYQSFAQQSLLNPDQSAGLDDYHKKSMEYGNQLLAQSNGGSRRYTENLLNYYYHYHRKPIVTNVLDQAKRVRQVDDIERNNRSTDDVLNAIHNADHSLGEHKYDSAMSLIAQQQKYMESQFIDGRMARDVYDHSYKTLKKKYTSEFVLEDYRHAVDQGKGQEFLKDLHKKGVDGFDSNDMKNLNAQIVRINKDHLAEAGLTMNRLVQQKKDEYKRIEETGAIPNAELTHTVNQVTPEKSQEFETQKAIARRLYNIKQATARMNPAESSQYLKSLLDDETNEIPMDIRRQIYDRAVKAVNLQRKQILEDPMKFTNEQPFISQSARNYQLAQNANAVGEHQNNSTINSTVEPPFKSAIQYQQSLGLSLTGKGNNSIRLMTNQEAQNRVIQIEQSTPAQKIRYMNKMHDEFGGGLPYSLAIKQLVAAGLPSQYGLASNIDPNSQDAQDIGNAFAIPIETLSKDLKAKNGSSFTALNSSITNQVFTGTGGSKDFQAFMKSANSYSGDKSIEYLDGIKGSLQQLSYYYLLSGKENSRDKALQRAQTVIANRYGYTTVDNSQIRVPKNYVASDIRKYALEQEKRVKDFPFVLSTQHPEEAKELVRRGHWANDPVDNGLIWVDFNGVVWKNKEGQPLAFSFEDAQYGMHSPEMDMLDELNNVQRIKAQEENSSVPATATSVTSTTKMVKVPMKDVSKMTRKEIVGRANADQLLADSGME